MDVAEGDVTFATRATAQPRGLRSGLLGAGFIGAVHARAIRAAGGTLVAVAEATPSDSAAAAGRLGAEWAADSAEELVSSDEVDVVHVCTPNHLHAQLVTLALEAGKHVICEKPLAVTVDEAEALVAAAATAGVVAAVPFVYRYYPTVLEARKRAMGGEIGPLRLLHGSYLQDWLSSASDQNWRTDPALGGASRTFADIGVHWCDLVEFATGHRITSLTARMLTAVPTRYSGRGEEEVGTEDAATLIFQTDGGALGSLVVSQVSPGRKNRLWFSLDGAESSLAFDQECPESLWVGSRDTTQLVLRGASSMSPEALRLSVLPAGHPQGYQDCFNGFVADVYAAVGGERAAELPTFADGLRAARITDAVLTSAADQSWVEVAS
jgi:predicted dehydrogenase